MPITTRQNTIYAAEDWKVLYDSFINADFQSYDFETLRKSMIDYIRIFYPEDFNDYIESSEFIALIDLIAYMGQNISYRVDVNARENFLGTAERRESILRLARLVSYNAKRNTGASGLLKMTSLSTTENIFDLNGNSLANTVITWNDPNNSNYIEQTNLILNSAFVNTQKVGNPNIKSVISGIDNEQYHINIPAGILPVYTFSENIDGIAMDFQIVSATIEDRLRIIEEPPSNVSAMGILYRNDGKGNGSNDTGFFALFKQGILRTADFSFNESIPNRVQFIDSTNIDNDDVWLYELDSEGRLFELWNKVPATNGNNIIFNSLNNNIRKIYSVNSREADQIAYVFGDGVFSDVPRGNFRGFFRQTNGLEYIIKTDDLQNITVDINYINRLNNIHTLRMTFSLQQYVTNSSQREDLDDIRINAPLQHYTQNRMVNGEDYNIFPITQSSAVIKAKSVNRTSSGISRYFDVVDPTSKYSSTNIFAEDGIIFRDFITNSFDFEFINEMDVLNIIRNRIRSILSNISSLHFYLDRYDKIKPDNEIRWKRTTSSTNTSTGYFVDQYGNPVSESSIDNNSLIMFVPPEGYLFDKSGRLVKEQFGVYDKIWSLVKNIVGDGLGNLDNGYGPVTISELVGDNSIISYIIPQFDVNFTTTMESSILRRILNYEEFALRYDSKTRDWQFIESGNINASDEFSFEFEGNTDDTRSDSSWMIHLKSSNNVYTVTYRGLNYYFESEIETRFYFDESVKIFDSQTGRTVRDQIRVLTSNTKPDSNYPLDKDYVWQIYGLDRNFDGSLNSRRVKITFVDSDDDGIPDDPTHFENIVNEDVNSQLKYVVYERYTNLDGNDQYQITKKPVNLTYNSMEELPSDLSVFINDEVIYFHEDNIFKIFNANINQLIDTDDFILYNGRDRLNFQYKHNSSADRRINPGTSNIHDMYILTRSYSNLYRQYILDNTGSLPEPSPETGLNLENEFNDLLQYKTLSDEIIFHPVVYKPLFGSKADLNLQATFKIVKNPSISITDTEVKTGVVRVINEYFDINNWDFGETFFFTELSSYIHIQLAPYISTIIIVPRGDNQVFGSLFQIQSESNEIFVSDAKVSDIDIIDSITATQIRASGNNIVVS